MISQIEGINQFKYHFFWGIPETLVFKHESSDGIFALAEMGNREYEFFWAVNDLEKLSDGITLAQRTVPHFRFRIAAPLADLASLVEKVKSLGYPLLSSHIGFRLLLNEYPIKHQSDVQVAHPGELEALMEMEKSIFPNMNLTVDEWRRWLTDESYQCLIYYQDHKPAGFILLQANSSQGFIRNLGVTEPFRRKGIGEALLLEALFNLRVVGVNRVMLWVDADNDPAIKLYKKHGFVQDENEAEVVFEV